MDPLEHDGFGEGEMDAHAHSGEQGASPALLAALTELARLAQQLLAASSPDLTKRGAARLLEHLLRLADRQQGALLLVSEPQPTASGSLGAEVAQRRTLRLLASEGMEEEELFALLACWPDPPEHDVLSLPSGWLLCQHPLGLPASLPPDESSLHALGSAPLPPTQRFVWLLGTQRRQESAPQQSVGPIPQHWPVLADAVGTVILSLLAAQKLEALQQQRRQQALEQMELFKAELVATVSHELRSPLASIQGYAATLLRHERRIGREERHEFLLAIEQAGRRLGTVIDRLLELSQLETGTIVLLPVPVNLAALAREAITAREERLGASALSLARWTFVLGGQDGAGLPTEQVPVVLADRRLLREALDQLIDNAVLYSPAGGTVVVGLRVREAEQVKQVLERVGKLREGVPSAVGERAEPMGEIWVQDQGVGIESGHLEQIFERFYRVDTTLSRRVNGLGIGLTMCKRIVELHDGLLWGESEVGRGSTFHLLLPLQDPDLTLGL